MLGTQVILQCFYSFSLSKKKMSACLALEKSASGKTFFQKFISLKRESPVIYIWQKSLPV